MNDDVKPLLQSADGDLRRVLEAATQHEPAPGDLAGLTKKLTAILPPGTLPPTTPSGGPPPPPPAAPAASGVGGAAKAMLAIGAIGALAIVGVVVTRSPSSSPSSSSSPSIPVATVSVSVSVSDSASPPPPIFPTAETSAEVPPPPRPRPTHSSAAPPPPETTILAGAHEQLLKGSPDKALAMTNEHAKAYPNGSMAQEREVIAIEALTKLGRREDAIRRAAQFHKSFPQSSHGERIDRLVK